MQPGDYVTQSVQLVREIGAGAMGTVWEARNVAIDNPVAVKFISAEQATEQNYERFKREASLAAKIQSPHALQIFDFGLMGNTTPFIVMELLKGEPLSARIKRGPLPLQEVATIVAQTAEVLGKAHALGIVHRDIKPDNLFLIESSYDVFVKVLDFGVAKQTNQAQGLEMTRTGAMVGTPYYMSPEMVHSAKGATPMADLWALAVVAYQALVGGVPFEAETLGGLCVAITIGQFQFPSQRLPSLPPAVDAWFQRALSTLIEQRYQSAQEMAAAFAAAAGGAPRSALPSVSESSLPALPPRMGTGTLTATEMSPPQTVPRGPAPARSSGRGMIAAIGIVSLLAVAVGIGGVVMLTSDAAPASPEPAFAEETSTDEGSDEAEEAEPEASNGGPEPEASTTAPEPEASAPEPEASASAPEPKPPSPNPAPRPVVPRPRPEPKPKSKNCMAYDSVKKKWVYTCGR
jgi:serine/threonine-protein kinase